MKREYKTPIAKKVTFEYEQSVVASDICQWGGQFTDEKRGCFTTNVPMGTYSTRMTCDWLSPSD